MSYYANQAASNAAGNVAGAIAESSFLENNGNMSLQLFVKQAANSNIHNTQDLIAEVKSNQKQIDNSLDELFNQLNKIGIEA